MRIERELKLLALLAVVLYGASLLPSQAHAQDTQAIEESTQVNGINLYFRSVGSGPPLVLVHGMTSAGRLWDPFIDDLSKNFRVIVPDMRGHGHSTNPSGHFRHVDVAQDLVELINHLGHSEVRAIGWSSGAIAILAMAIRHPELLKAAVLINGAHRFPDQTRDLLRSLDTELFVNSEPWYWNQVISWHPGGRSQLDELFGQLRAFGGSPKEGQYTAAQLAKITVPTMIVHGDRDVIFPVQLAFEMHAALPVSDLWVMPGVTHSAMFVYHHEPLEKRCSPCEAAGHQFAKAVSDFFERADSQ